MSNWPEFFAGLSHRLDEEIGTTEWFTLDQRATDIYAALIADLDPMHNDPDWEGTEQWGGTIVVGTHGLCLLPSLLAQHGFPVEEPAIEFQPIRLERVRFIASLNVGQRARDHAVLRAVTDGPASTWQICTEHTIEREGEERPFMHAVFETRYRLPNQGS